jgi:hypothetical protein
MDGFMIFGRVLVYLVIAILPSLVAYLRRHRNSSAITLLHILPTIAFFYLKWDNLTNHAPVNFEEQFYIGAAIAFWFAALVWSWTCNTEPRQKKAPATQE